MAPKQKLVTGGNKAVVPIGNFEVHLIVCLLQFGQFSIADF